MQRSFILKNKALLIEGCAERLKTNITINISLWLQSTQCRLVNHYAENTWILPEAIVGILMIGLVLYAVKLMR